jgi:hypothetical protein
LTAKIYFVVILQAVSPLTYWKLVDRQVFIIKDISTMEECQERGRELLSTKDYEELHLYDWFF